MRNDDDDHIGVEKLREIMNVKLELFEAQIRKLSELRDEGLLTEEEFAAKKKELLGQIG
jgi:hypothetical protein